MKAAVFNMTGKFYVKLSDNGETVLPVTAKYYCTGYRNAKQVNC